MSLTCANNGSCAAAQVTPTRERPTRGGLGNAAYRHSSSATFLTAGVSLRSHRSFLGSIKLGTSLLTPFTTRSRLASCNFSRFYTKIGGLSTKRCCTWFGQTVPSPGRG